MHAITYRASHPGLVVILGPTTTGKTDLAASIAREIGGELVNADKFYLFDGFAIGTGRADVEAHADLRRHLYACVAPDGALPSVGVWARWLKAVVTDVRRRGRVPIVEGSSFGLASAAAALATRTPMSRVLGLRWRDQAGLSERVATRVAAACGAGLIAETKAALAAGLGESWVMRKSVVYPHVVSHLKGLCTQQEACARIGEAAVVAASVQYQKFRRLRGVTWFGGPRAARAAWR